MKNVAIVAIVRDEQPFVDEWMLYHRLIGVDHFFLYDDDDSDLGLRKFLEPHQEYSTVIEWHNLHQQFPSRRGDRQTKAYLHALAHFLSAYQWVAFIDLDEFIVLDEHKNLKELLESAKDIPSIALNWHIFGHNGHYDDPRLVTSELTRRRVKPDTMGKCITRCDCIEDITSVHLCKLKNSRRPIRTNAAHLNHYMCRSFTRWMSRPDRGYACDVPALPENAWNFSKEGCLRKFVTDVSLNWNEHIDEYMLQYKSELETALQSIRRP